MTNNQFFLKCSPHWGAARRLRDGQKIHGSVNLSNYSPKAVLATTGEKPNWGAIFEGKDQFLGVEKDLLDIVSDAANRFLEDVENDDAWQEVERWLQLGEQSAM